MPSFLIVIIKKRKWFSHHFNYKLKQELFFIHEYSLKQQNSQLGLESGIPRPYSKS